MAVQEKHDSGVRADLEEASNQRSRQPLPGSARERFTWGWLWVVVIIALVIWFGGWGWGGYGGWWGWGSARTTAFRPPKGAVNGNQLLAAGNQKHFVGRTVEFRNVKVQDKAGKQGIFVGPHLADQVLVILPAKNSSFRMGSKVSLAGVVHTAPPEQQAQESWGLDPNQAEILQADGIYVEATQVQR